MNWEIWRERERERESKRVKGNLFLILCQITMRYLLPNTNKPCQTRTPVQNVGIANSCAPLAEEQPLRAPPTTTSYLKVTIRTLKRQPPHPPFFFSKNAQLSSKVKGATTCTQLRGITIDNKPLRKVER